MIVLQYMGISDRLCEAVLWIMFVFH
jgi:hypothetical protein